MSPVFLVQPARSHFGAHASMVSTHRRLREPYGTTITRAVNARSVRRYPALVMDSVPRGSASSSPNSARHAATMSRLTRRFVSID